MIEHAHEFAHKVDRAAGGERCLVWQLPGGGWAFTVTKQDAEAMEEVGALQVGATEP